MIESVAALAFALCVAFSLHLWGVAPAGAVAAALVAGIAAHRLLARVGRRPAPRLFEAAEMPLADPAADELLLDDPLSVDPDSNVVRLFGGTGAGRSAPGELASRIDRFLNDRCVEVPPQPPASDAAQELNEALAAIRRTLRQG